MHVHVSLPAARLWLSLCLLWAGLGPRAACAGPAGAAEAGCAGRGAAWPKP